MSIREVSPGHLEATCDICGKDLTVTSKEYGMDCEDRCGEKHARKLIDEDPIIAELFGILTEDMTDEECETRCRKFVDLLGEQK